MSISTSMDAVTMPAKDRYHAVVVRALIKDGWTITDEQVAVILGERRLWIDIEAVKAPQHLAILVEVKGFEHMPSPVDYLADAVGKYVLYCAALDYGGVDTPLFLAVPTAAYEGILNEDIGRQAIAKAGMNLIIFDPLKEEISLMDTLRDRLQLAMEGYAGRALNGYSYLMSSADHQVFAIVSVGHVRDRRIVDTGLVARLVGDRIIIERDVNDKPLVDALVEAGVPRGQIVLAYAGESTDEAA